MNINESDWKVFRRLHSIALERYCERALEDVRHATTGKGTYHDRYRKVYRVIHNHDKRIAAAFDDPRRSTAFLLLANIIAEELLTEEELQQFSPEAQERIESIKRMQR
jgi:hypothetical protein